MATKEDKKRDIQAELRQMTDPIAYRDQTPQGGYDKYIEGWDGTKLKNADVNISQYGDDSSSKNYNNTALWGGENQKYTGENTLGSQVAYNPNATLEGLNPDYKYGQAAQMANSQNANYIASRNDEIASALYNAGKTSIQDVEAFLASQSGWDYSNANERANTVSSVWKRIGQIAEQNKNEGNENPTDTSKMEADLNKSSNDKIYGKATANTGDPMEGIIANEDVNAPINQRNEARIANVKTLLSADSDVWAALMLTGSMPYGEQAWVDLQTYYPEKYKEVMDAKKKMIDELNINSISNGTGYTTNADIINTSTSTTDYAIQNASLSVSATQLLKAIDAALESNDTAKSSEELMNSIKKDIAKLKDRLLNLNKEANTVFKGDVPDYIIKAYVNNRSQEIQRNLSQLEDRYNAAYDIYKTQLAHSEWEEEMKLKKDSLELEWWKAKNTSTTTNTSTTDNANYTVAERNNNPTNMTKEFCEIMGAELGVDYEISTDSFVNSNGQRQYYAKLIGDPVKKTIEILDKGIANGKNPFTTTSRSYINSMGLTKDKWLGMTQEQKEDTVKKRVKYEGGTIDNMEYYRENPGVSSIATNKGGYGYKGREFGYDPAYVDSYKAFLGGKLSGVQFTNLLKVMGVDENTFGRYVQNWQQHVQNQGNAAGVDVLNDIAALWINLEDLDRVDYDDEGNLTLDVNSYLMFHGSTGAIFDKLLSELKLQRMVKSKEDGANYGNVTEKEWEMIESASTTLKNQARFNFLGLGPGGTDEGFTQGMEDLLNATWKATFHKDLTAEDWNDYIEDLRNNRANFNLVNLGEVNVSDATVKSNLGGGASKADESANVDTDNNQATKDALFGG